MRKIIFAVLIMILMSVCVFAVDTAPYAEARSLGFFERLSHSLFSGKYVSGGTLTPDTTVNKGDFLNSQIEIRFTKDATGTPYSSKGYHYRVTLWFTDDYNTVIQKVGTFYFSTPQEKGDWIAVNINNIDTSKLDNSWCSKGIKLTGLHEVYLDGAWVEDQLGSIKWTSNLGATYTTNDNFKLVCADETNKCERKIIETTCGVNGAPMQVWQSGYKDSNGNCARDNTYLSPCRSNEACKGGSCVAETICTAGEFQCQLNGKVSVPCVNGQWLRTVGTGLTAVCPDGCDDVSGKCKGQSIKEPGSLGCSDSQTCQTGYFCNNGVCDRNYENQTVQKNDTNGFCSTDADCTNSYVCKQISTTVLDKICTAPGSDDRTGLDKKVDRVKDAGTEITSTTEGKIIVAVIVLMILAIIGILIFGKKKRR